MKHITEPELIEYFYGESADQRAVQEHLAECAECVAMGRELARDMAEIRLNDCESERSDEYGDEVWHAIRPLLTPYLQTPSPRRLWPWRTHWNLRPGLGFAGAVVVLSAIAFAAFYSGRLWEQKQMPQLAATNNTQAGQRIILFVVSDHLDRSQRLLAELNDPDQAAADHSLQATARELLTENRLYRQSAERGSSAKDGAQAQDSSLEAILNDLEPVLVELANQPDDLNRAAIMRLRKQLHTAGLLFEIRVLRSKVDAGQTNDSDARKNGMI
ncbi:hypothetical protein [Acidicapsa acidisoli]|uniref:hypothetical protein n=1 Tax=Acidicapsa acidisoli TaxID=1615681 RepID=UPI0021E0F991|nr:hypothetical protein [Acidicapsa acidisoli]